MKYSELYAEKSTIRLGTEETISLTDTFPNLLKVNEPIDTSIVYTTCKDNALQNATIDIDLGANNNVTFVYDTIALNNGKYINKIKYAPIYQNEQFKPQYVLVNNHIPYWNGVNFDKTEVIGKNSQSKFVRNMKTNNMLFRVSLKGCYKSDISENYNNKPNVIDINLLDLINNPELYYITNISIINPYVFYMENGVYKTTTPDIKICLLNSTDTSTGITAISNCIRMDPFDSSAPREVSFLSNKSGQKGNFLGGGDNEILYNMTKYYSVDTMPEFEMDFPNFDITEITETVIKNYGIKKIAECANSIFCQDTTIKFNYNATATPTTTITNTIIKLYRLLKGEFVVKLLAGAGLYFIPADTILPNELTPDNLGNYDFVCLGEMDIDGYTTGRFIVGNDINTYTGYNKNGSTQNDNFDPGNPPGEDKDDDSDDINFGGSYAGLGAFAKFYLCSGLAVSELNSWINGRDPNWPANFDPMTQIISVSRFATDISSASYGSTTIKFHTAAGTEIDTKISALHGNGDNIELDLGSVNIPLRMKERGIPFLDYESTIELYIPACGTFILDPQTVLGSTLSVKMWLSTSTGECNSIAYVTRNGVKAPVAYGSGSLAVPMPVTSIGWGTYLASVTNANIKYYFGALGAASSETQMLYNGYSGNQFGMASGLSGIISSFQNAGQAEQNLVHLKNSSFTSVSGSFGSTAAWNYPFNAYVKITRRHFKKPSNYAHTRGIPLVETKTLRDCSGFTICVNADVTSINATIQEKNMIVEALNNGVIV